MILKGSQRAGGKQLAHHLLKTHDNEHVEVHELRGFVSTDLESAFNEAYAISRGTRAKKFLFSLSLNPPPGERVPIAVFEDAINRAERKLGLDGQPRAIVFHEKEGRRHAHAVWSRIDGEAMTAIKLPYYRLRLSDISRELYLEHGWDMPKGFVKQEERDDLSYEQVEAEQARRAGLDPAAIKAIFRQCWERSDSKEAFQAALKASGFELARGSKRGHVAVDREGKIYAVSRYTGVLTKQVRERLGDPSKLQTVEEAMNAFAASTNRTIQRRLDELAAHHRVQAAALKFRRDEIIQRQRTERARLERGHKERWEKETRDRAFRISRGFRGLWDRLTGKHAEIRKQNEREALLSLRRDRAEKDDLIFRHIEERATLSKRLSEARQQQSSEVQQLRNLIAAGDRARNAPNLRAQFRKANPPRGPGKERDRGFDFDL